VHKLTDAQSEITKAYGEQAGGRGFRFPAFTRLPTGILTLDVSLAGGIPMGAVSIFYGNESSGKTSLALRCAAQFQKRYPAKKVVWLDVENTWDEAWVKLHGVNPDDVYLFRPTTAEEAADIGDEVSMSEDAGLIVVDSLAALASIDQLEKTAEQTVIAGSAKPSTTLLRKIGAGIVEHSKAKSLLTVIYINQTRNKIGFVMGNPEILPGPSYQNYQAFLKLRLSAKPILKEKLAAVPIYAENSMRVVKKKFPCIRTAAEWQTILYPYEGHKPLDVNNHVHAENILTELDYLVKDGKKWVLYPDGEVFDTKKAAVESALKDYDAFVNFLVDDLLLLYKDDIQAQMAGEPVKKK
jgi:recombination protein RecA